MIITCLGHSKFLMELDSGYRIVTDPFDEKTGYPVNPLSANAVFVSHHHFDHCAVETITGYETIVDTAGDYTLTPDIRVKAIMSDHDDVQGSKRGKNLLFLLEAEGIRVAHLGDLGTLPNQEQLDALGRVDVLMIPVGGFYTIDAKQAKQVAEMIGARVILPMHYRTRFNADWPIGPVEEFTGLYPASETLDLLRVTAEDLSCQPKVAVLRAQV